MQTRAVIESCEQAFADSKVSFLKGFTNLEDELNEKSHRLSDRNGTTITPSYQPVIYAAAMLKLRSNYGGDEWLKRFFKYIMQCPNVKSDTREGALKQSLNWLVASSAAAKKDLTPVFVNRWRMPLARSTQAVLAKVDWAAKDLDLAALIAQLPVEFQK